MNMDTKVAYENKVREVALSKIPEGWEVVTEGAFGANFGDLMWVESDFMLYGGEWQKVPVDSMSAFNLPSYHCIIRKVETFDRARRIEEAEKKLEGLEVFDGWARIQLKPTPWVDKKSVSTVKVVTSIKRKFDFSEYEEVEA